MEELRQQQYYHKEEKRKKNTQKDGKRKEKIEKTLTETIFPPDERRRRESFFSSLFSNYLLSFFLFPHSFRSREILLFLIQHTVYSFFYQEFCIFSHSSRCSFLTWDFLEQVTNFPHACMHACLFMLNYDDSLWLVW